MIGGWLGRRGRADEAAKFRGRVVVVTGGSKGLGLLLAREYGQLGARVEVLARDGNELNEAGSWLASHGVEANVLACDLRDRDQTRTTLEQLENRRGGVYCLVNNAGIIQVGPLASLAFEDFEEAVATMFWGVVLPSLTVLPAMRQRGEGHIVNIVSIGGKVSVPHLLPYNSAKFGALGFSEGLRAELSGSGVDVTTVVPGLMRTGSFINASFKGAQAREFALFSALASLPLLSIDAEATAARIVRATLNGEPELILSLPANFAARLQALMPGTSSAVLGMAARLLPSTTGPTGAAEGIHLLPEAERSRVLSFVLRRGKDAARRFQPPFRSC